MKQLLALTLLLISTSSHSSLLPRLGGLAVYDTDLNITWLADANLAKSNTFGIGGINADGTMDWMTAYYQWLPAMNAHDGTGYLGFNDWRLPRTLQPDPTCSLQHPDQGSIGHSCMGSEMGHLYHIGLGGTPPSGSVFDSGHPDLALFTNLDLGRIGGAWSETIIDELLLGCCDSNGDAVLMQWGYYFRFVPKFGSGGQQEAGPLITSDAWVPWAVRDGDVLSAQGQVPAPPTIWLFGSMLGFLLFAGRKPTAG